MTLRSILILSSKLNLGCPCGLFPSGFPTKTQYVFIFSPHTCYMSLPSHSHLRYHPNDIWWGLKIMKLLIVQFSLVPCYLLPLSSKIFLSSLCSDTRSIRPSCNATGQVSHWHKATVEIMVLCTLIFILLYEKDRRKTGWKE